MLAGTTNHQAGMSLVELLVGLVIGLLATLVIMQTFSAFEGQKRTTTGSSDAQTNGAVALMSIQRSVQLAGYGLSMPMADVDTNPLMCDITGDFQLDPAVPETSTNFFPIEINDGGGSANDTITVRYSTSAKGAVPVTISQVAGTRLTVENVIGCGAELTAAAYDAVYPTERPNVVFIQKAGSNVCGMALVDQQPVTNGVSQEDQIDLVAMPAGFTQQNATITAGEDRLTCIGNWADYTFDIVSNQLRRNQQPIISDVVSLQAQYGVSATASSNDVTSWVDATGAWANPTVDNRNRIKAIRLALVLRNGLKEKDNVTTTTPKAWLDGNNTIDIDVSGLSDWQKYRYRTVGTTIPLRNMLWSREAL